MIQSKQSRPISPTLPLLDDDPPSIESDELDRLTDRVVPNSSVNMMFASPGTRKPDSDDRRTDIANYTHRLLSSMDSESPPTRVLNFHT